MAPPSAVSSGPPPAASPAAVTPRPSGPAPRRPAWFHRRGWRDLLIAVPGLWLGLFVMLPFAIVVAMSVATRTPTAPPFGYGGENPAVNLEGYARVWSDGLYLRALGTSLANAALATMLCLALGYPMALALTRIGRGWRTLALMLVVLPFWTSFLLRVYAWMGLFGSASWFNGLATAGWNLLVPEAAELRALPMMRSNFAVIVVMVYSYLPFMVLPLYASLERLDPALDEAAMDLGARPMRVFLDVTLPQSLPGIAAGALLVFIPAAGEVVIPGLVGDPARPMIGRIIADEFAVARDWPMASAVAVALVVAMVLPLMARARLRDRAEARRERAP